MNELELNVEAMERRLMMAGDVSVRIVNGDLRVTGDNADNALQMYQVPIPDLGMGIRFEGVDGTTINGEDVFVLLFGDAVTDDVRINLRGGNNRLAMLTEDGPTSTFDWQVPDDLIVISGGGDDVLYLQATSVDDVDIRSGAGEDAISVEFGAVADQLRLNAGGGNDSVGLFSLESVARTSVNLGGGDDVLLAAGMATEGHVQVSMGGGDDSMFVINSDFEFGIIVNGGGGADAIVETRATAPLDYGRGLTQRSIESHRDVSGSDWLNTRAGALQGTSADEALTTFLLDIGVI